MEAIILFVATGIAAFAAYLWLNHYSKKEKMSEKQHRHH